MMQEKSRIPPAVLPALFLLLFGASALNAAVREVTSRIQGITCKKEVLENQITMEPCYFQWRGIHIVCDTSTNSAAITDSDWHVVKLLQKDSVEYINTIFFFESGDYLYFATEQSAGLSEERVVSVTCYDLALAKVWEKLMQTSNLGVPMVRNGYLYLTVMERIGKYRLSDGKPMWEIGWPDQHLYASFKQPSYLINTIIFPDAASDRRLIVDDDSGKVIKMDE